MNKGRIRLKNLYDIAVKHLELGELDQAEEALHAYLKENPTDAMAHNKLGVVFIQRSNLEASKRCFEEALDYDSSCIQALNNLGNIAREEGKLEQAIEYYKKAILINKDYPLPHNNLGVVYKQLNLYGDFIREMKIAKRLEKRQALSSKEKTTIKDWLMNLWSKLRK